MSLVNDALQKVHAQTTQQKAAGVSVPGAVPGAAYRFNAPRGGSSPVLWIVGGAVVLAGLAVAVTIVLVHRTPRVSSPTVVAAAPTPAPAPVAPMSAHAPVVAQAPTTQPVATAVPPRPPAQPPTATPAASGLASTPTAAPTNPPPATQPAPVSVTPPVEAGPTPIAAAAAPPTTAPSTAAGNVATIAAPTNVSAPVAPQSPQTAVIDLQSLNVPGLGKLKLTGIALSPFGTRAVINNTILSVGDQVGPATITDIQDKRVKLEIDGKNYTLSLP